MGFVVRPTEAGGSRMNRTVATGQSFSPQAQRSPNVAESRTVTGAKGLLSSCGSPARSIGPSPAKAAETGGLSTDPNDPATDRRGRQEELAKRPTGATPTPTRKDTP
jgi:hypothetical protein